MYKKGVKQKVSVIVPMYNVSQIIIETIESLKKQDYTKVEFILVDDGSTDKTYKTAKKLIGVDNRFKLIQKQNGGVASARNKGIELSNGEYLMFVDSDDILAESAISTMVTELEKNKVDMVVGATKQFNEDSSWYIKMHKAMGIYSKGIKTIKSNPELFYAIALWGKLFKRKLVISEKVPNDLHYAEDQIITFNAYLGSRQIMVIDTVVYYYRVRNTNDSLTQSIKSRAVEYVNNMFLVLESISKIVKKNKNFSVHDKKKIYCLYLERFFTFEFFPSYFVAVKDKKKQRKLLKELINWIKEQSVFTISNTPALRYFILIELKRHLFFIRLKNYYYLQQLIKLTINKLDEKSLRLFHNSWEDQFRDTNKLLKLLEKKRLSFKHILTSFAHYVEKEKRIKQDLFNKIYNLSLLLPVNSKKIVFGSTKVDKLNVNSNLYHIYNKVDGGRYTKKLLLGRPTYWYKEIFKYYHLATAKYIFVDDYYNLMYGKKIRKKTEYIQTWHGAGAFKKFGFAALGKEDSNSLEFEEAAHGNYTKILCSSNEITPLYAKAFNLDEERVIPLFPRLDYFTNIDTQKIKGAMNTKHPHLSSKKKILFAPTFRGNVSERKHYVLDFDWEELRRLDSSYVLIVKLHPVVEKYTTVPNDLKNRVIILNHENINDLMVWCDILVTDYSSIIFEYSILNKPIIHYLKEYSNYENERGFFMREDAYIYGKKALDFKELVSHIETAQYWNEDNAIITARNRFKSLFINSHYDNTGEFLNMIGLTDKKSEEKVIKESYL